MSIHPVQPVREQEIRQAEVKGPPRVWGIITDKPGQPWAGTTTGSTTLIDIEGPLRVRVASHGRHPLISVAQNSGTGPEVVVVGDAWPLDEDQREGADLVRALYGRVGADFANRCDGQFAAVVIDAPDRSVTLTVGWPGGAYPLYYTVIDGHLVFASRLDALLRCLGTNPGANENALFRLLVMGGLFCSDTLLRGINRVIPGYAVKWQPGSPPITKQVVRFDHQVHDGRDCPEEFLELHLKSLRRQTRGVSKIGAFLSGGVDSSLNVALLAEHATSPIETFTLAFSDSQFDESHKASIVAERCGTRHHVLRIADHRCLDRLPAMVWAIEEPTIDYSVIPSWLLADFVGQHAPAAIGGDGPDHLLGRKHGPVAWHSLVRALPLGCRLAAWLTAEQRPDSKVRHAFWTRLRRLHQGRQLWLALACSSSATGSALSRAFASMLWNERSPTSAYRLMSRAARARLLVDETLLAPEIAVDREAPSALVAFSVADCSLCGLAGVFAKAGKTATGSGLLLREPYLSRPSVRYLLDVSPFWKFRGSWWRRLLNAVPSRNTKLLLRSLHSDRLPHELATMTKQGFEPPLAAWLRDSMREHRAEQLFQVLMRDTDWFDREQLELLVHQHVNGDGDNTYLLFLLCCLEQWYRIYIQHSGQPPS